MDLFGLTSDRVMARVQQNGALSSPPSSGRSLPIGSFGFCLASLSVFATATFAEWYMRRNLGPSRNLPRPPNLARAFRLLPKNGRAAMLNARGAGLQSQIPNNTYEGRRKRQ